MRKVAIGNIKDDPRKVSQVDQNANGDLLFTNPTADGAPERNERQDKAKPRARTISRVSMQSDSEADDLAVLKEGSSRNFFKLHHFILNGEMKELEKALSSNEDIDTSDPSGKTALHTAILCKQIRSVEMLLDAGADLSVADENGDTPMHTAIRVGSQKIVEILLRHGGDGNTMGRNGCTPLHLAAAMDNVDICKLLVENDAFIDQEDGDRMTPLGQAMDRGATHTAEYLLKTVKETQPESMENLLFHVDTEGSTLLHLAVNSSILKNVELCVEYGARLRQPKKSTRRSAFHMACDQGFFEIVQFMHSKDPAICRIIMMDKAGETPIHLAAKGNHVQVVKFLLEKGAAVDPLNHERQTPLFLAASRGAAETVQLLIENGADIMARDVHLRSALHCAVGFTSTMEHLIQSPAAVTLITEKDVYGFSPIHYVAKRGDSKTAALLVSKNKAAASALSNAQDTPIHVAAKYGKTETVEKLFEKQNPKILNIVNEKGRTALHFACAKGHNKVADLLLTQGAIVEKDQEDQTPLHLAAASGSLRCCECIIQRYPDCVNEQDQKEENTAIHLAATNGHPDVVSYLLSVREQDILMNGNKNNILDIAVNLEKKSVAAAIAKHERWREVLFTCSTGKIPILQQMTKTMPEIVQHFLDNCVSPSGDPATKTYRITYNLGLIQGPVGPNSLVLLETMSRHHREKCLTHPVCFLLLNFKWRHLGWLSLVMGVLFSFLQIAPITALAIYTRVHEEELCGFNASVPEEDINLACSRGSLTVQALNGLVLIITILQLIFEIIQIARQKAAYFMDVVNYIQITSFVASVIYVVRFCDCKSGGMREVGAVALFFGWVNFIIFLRKMSSCGVYLIMLTTMFNTMCKVLIIWILFIIAFASTFYLLVGKEEADNLAAFGDFPLSMMTIFVMTLGELNYHGSFLPWEELHYPTLTNIMFILLVLGMPIIMMNMLVGLAVGDIGAIQKNAVIDRYILQIELLVSNLRTIPMWLHKRVSIEELTIFPNQDESLWAKLKKMLIGFSAAKLEEEEVEDTVTPAIEQLNHRIQVQENRMDTVMDMTKNQLMQIKEIMDARRRRMERAQ